MSFMVILKQLDIVYVVHSLWQEICWNIKNLSSYHYYKNSQQSQYVASLPNFWLDGFEFTMLIRKQITAFTSGLIKIPPETHRQQNKKKLSISLFVTPNFLGPNTIPISHDEKRSNEKQSQYSNNSKYSCYKHLYFRCSHKEKELDCTKCLKTHFTIANE